MNTKGIPDFTDSERWVVRSTLQERYGKDIELQMADTEVALGKDNQGMSWCPALFWSAKGANFTIVKTAAKNFRAFFYYHPEHQLGTGIENYNELGDCVINVLQVDSDHIRRQKIKADETPSKPDEDSPDKPDTKPLFWGD